MSEKSQMSQRIADALEVLDLIRGISKTNPNEGAEYWRLKAIERVATRGVNKTTVFSHLSGKNTSDKLGASKLDSLIGEWIEKNSMELGNWIVGSCKSNFEKKRVNSFFSKSSITPIAEDINEPGETVKHFVTTYRVLRDTALARRIKEDNDYFCQACGERILLGNGTPYAEAHHVKPLGHDGPDAPGNIVCVCPNCHVKLDYGAIKISQKTFKNVFPEFIHYHNENIFKVD